MNEAVREVTHFFSNYHSVRYNRDEILLRLVRKPTDQHLQEIREKFSDIKMYGDFRLEPALAVERDEPALANLHRLVFAFNRKDHGRLRQLINHLNDLPA